MVCLGNICRSPLAEGIMKSKLPQHFIVDSAGTIALHEGQEPDRRSVITAKNNGVNISSQRAKHFKKEDLDKYDLIYCMDLHNYEDVLSLAHNEHHRAKVKLLLEEAGNHASAEVPDPYYGDMYDFEKVYELLDNACGIIAEKLTANVSTGTTKFS